MMRMSNSQYIEVFVEMVDAGLVKGNFGPSVAGQYKQKGKVTVPQLNVIKKIVDEKTTPAPQMETESVGDFAGVIELFTKAKGKLKYPKITMHYSVTHEGDEGSAETHHPLQLSLAGPKAKKPGSINVTDGGPYGSNTWYGRVLRDGTWEKSSKATREVGKVLQELSANPAAFATKYGHKHGHCCFCNKKLTQENSVLAGFGPVCASNWGLKSEWDNAVELSLD